MARGAAPGLIPAIPKSWLVASPVDDLLTPSSATTVSGSPEMPMKAMKAMKRLGKKRKIGCSKKKDGESDDAWAKRVDLENQAKAAKADLKAMKTQSQKEKVAREDKKVIKSAMKVSPATTVPGSLEMAKKIWPKITVIYVLDCATVGSVDII